MNTRTRRTVRLGMAILANGKVYQVINAQGPAAGLVAPNAKTGKILWSISNGTLESTPTVVQPAAGDAVLFTTCADNVAAPWAAPGHPEQR